MKRKPRVYLDTSVISALFDKSNPERKHLTETFFNGIENFETYISEIAIAEIERTPNLELRDKLRKKISGFLTLSLTEEVEWLAKEYTRYGTVPEGYPEDAYHIAVAVINEMDCLLSWNFKHIVRRKTKDIVRIEYSK